MKTLFIPILSVLFLLISCGSSPEHDEISAQLKMEKFVNDNLKSPSTAKFEYGFSTKIDKVGEKGYKVDSYVDSQNGFGATIRTNFHCEVEYTRNGKWKLIDLTFE